MRSQEKKLTVLHQLSQEAKPISLQELLKNLGENYAERSVRRWLNEMVKEGLIEQLGQGRGTVYNVIQKINRQAGSTRSCFRKESAQVIELVKKPLYERNLVTYSSDWLNAYKPNITFYIPLKYRLLLRKIGERSHSKEPAGTYAHKIFNRLLIDLSYNSSRLEGNTYSLLDTERLAEFLRIVVAI